MESQPDGSNVLAEQVRRLCEQIELEQKVAKQIRMRTPGLACENAGWRFQTLPAVPEEGLCELRVTDAGVQLLILRVTGFSGAAAMLLERYLRDQIAPQARASEAIQQANRALMALGLRDDAFALLVTGFFTAEGAAETARAGGMYPIYSPNGQPQVKWEIPGFFLGFADTEFPAAGTVMKPGDKLLLGMDISEQSTRVEITRL